MFCESSMPSRNGKGLQLFRSRLKSVRVVLEEGHLKARVKIHEVPSGIATPVNVREQVINLTVPAATTA